MKSATVSKRSIFTALSTLSIGLAAVIRIIYYFLVAGSVTPWFFLSQILLPVMSGILFIIFVYLYGEKTLLPTVVPVWMGVLFFLLKALTFPSLTHTLLCTLLYLSVAALFLLAVKKIIPKELLYLLFGLPFLYHLFVEDREKLLYSDPPLTLTEWLPEISVLLIMLSLFFLSMAMNNSKSIFRKKQ